MESIIFDNKALFSKLVAGFNPLPTKKDSEEKEKDGSTIGSDTIIAVRVRPLLDPEKEKGHLPGVILRRKGKYVDIHNLRQRVRGPPDLTTTTFQFERTYGPESTSVDIYEELVAPLVPWAWAGGIGTLFAYGQTGSGKTFTIDALAKQAAEKLFDGTLGDRNERDVFLSVFELAGNVASDLLNDRYPIKVMEDSFGESQLVGAQEPRVTSAAELLALIDRSMSFRKSAPTLKNEASSRTHAVCRIKIVNKKLSNIPDGLLFLIDLAGSEAPSDIREHSAELMKETREINTSLSVLKDCIRGRSLYHIKENQSLQASAGGSGGGVERIKQAHIPYRNSTLTKVLKHVFDTKGSRHCKTSVIACVGSSFVDAAPARNTFRYAELLSVPTPVFKGVVHHDKIPSSWSNEFLREWIEKNSGHPPINPSLLAPSENGMQICRLPAGDFISRCLQTPGVDEQHGRAFHAKLIALHIDSRRIQPSSSTATSSASSSQINLATNDAKEDKEATKPFKDRFRAGMFVQVNKAHEKEDYTPIYMIMSPESGFDAMYTEGFYNTLGDLKNNSDPVPFGQGKRGVRYICCEVAPAPLPGAYEIDVRRQKLLSVNEMWREVLMEYDRGTRYYYLTV